MQRLTEHHPDEQPVAHGVYQHTMGDLATGTNEAWELRRLHETRILRLHFSTEAYMVVADVRYQQGRLTRFQYKLLADNRAKGDYQVQEDKLHVERTIGDDTRLEEDIPWSDDVVFDAPFVACKGFAILRLAQDNSVPAFAPHLKLAERAGDLAKKQAHFVGEDTHGRHYRYGRDYWLDEHGMVVRAADDSMGDEYVMELTEYERSE
jgi:hypothetical protein